MPTLYKFAERKWMDEFFSTGSLRLRTVRGYRNTSEHGVGVGDHTEGRHDVFRLVQGTRPPQNDDGKALKTVGTYKGLPIKRARRDLPVYIVRDATPR